MNRFSRYVLEGKDGQRVSYRFSSRHLLNNQLNLPGMNNRFSVADLIANPVTSPSTLSFAEAGKEKEEEIKRKKQKEAPFQQIDFLIRDWQNFTDEEDTETCLKEVDEYKTQVLGERNVGDLKETRDHIHQVYQNFNVFMLPDPGKEVKRITYDGSIEKIDHSFKVMLGFYIEYVMKHLMPKLITKTMIYGDDFEEYLLFELSRIDSPLPTPTYSPMPSPSLKL